jgi:tripartite-type tricarboxylate transporter receptor subunit TctC
MRSIHQLALCGLLTIAFSATAHAQAYPNKPVRIVVPFPPGGGGDTIMRLLTEKLTAALGQPIVVDNRGGAAGRLGTEYVARAAPDGYTLLQGSPAAIVIAPALFPKLPYKSPGDFAAVSLLAYDSQVLVVHPSVPARSIKELIALAKARPGQFNFASSGAGDMNHLSAELFDLQAGINMVHVPYKGNAPGMLSIMTGETDLMFINIIPALPQIKANKLRALGVSSLKRSPILPDVPTLDESGLPGFAAVPFYAVLAPAGTPREIIQRLNQEFVKALHSSDIKNRFTSYGLDIVGGTPEELDAMITADIVKWSKVIKQAHIKPPD